MASDFSTKVPGHMKAVDLATVRGEQKPRPQDILEYALQRIVVFDDENEGSVR